MSINKDIIHVGLFELRDYLISKIPDVVFEVSNSNTIEYFLGERYEEKALIVLLEFVGINIEKRSNNSHLAVVFKPKISVQVYSSVVNNNEVNFIDCTETWMLIVKYLNNYISDYFGKLYVTEQQSTPLETYAQTENEAYKISWGMPIEFEGLIKLNTNNIGV